MSEAIAPAFSPSALRCASDPDGSSVAVRPFTACDVMTSVPPSLTASETLPSGSYDATDIVPLTPVTPEPVP